MAVVIQGCYVNSFSKISRRLGALQGDKRGSFKAYTFHDIRKLLQRDGQAAFLDRRADTIYLIESFSLEEGTYDGQIWTSENSLNYQYYARTNTFTYKEQPVASKYVTYLVKNWDTAKIRYEEQHSASIYPPMTIYASIIIEKEGSYNYQTIRFGRFYNKEKEKIFGR